MSVAVLDLHQRVAAGRKPLMAFDPEKDLAAQTAAAREKLMELMGVPEKTTDPRPIIEYTCTDDPRFDEVRFTFETEPGLFIPCHMLLPKGTLGVKKNLPAVICLQGHSTGMHISLGRPKFEGDQKTISGGDRDFCIQAVALGYVAIAMEQRGFGELDGTLVPGQNRCMQPSIQAQMLGRTLIGERASDVSRLIDALEHVPEVDTASVGLMGNSGGGTATFYTACVEPRVRVAMPSCAFCSLHDSIFSLSHCICNYIPGLYKYFEMGDLAMLIAPRPLIVVCGKDDNIFPLAGVRREFDTVEKIYEAAGCPDRCRMIVGPEGHRFYAALGWPVYAEMLAK